MFSFLFGGARRRKANGVARKCALGIEALEDRSVPATFAVTNALDDGAGSLRDAVAKANASGGADEILIQVENNASRISLTHGELLVTDDLTINGQGMQNTILSGGRLTRHFNVEGSGNVKLTLKDMALFQGAAQGEGGAVRLAGAKLDAQRVNFVDNQADKGGAVALVDRNGAASEAVFDGSIFFRNTAGTSGGALFVHSNVGASQGAHAILRNTNIAYNQANSPLGGGGGVAAPSGVVNVENSSLILNNAQGAGGGIDAGQNSTVNILGSTLHQNSANSGLGGAGILSKGRLVISNSTITGNSDTSTNGVGGIRHISPVGMQLSSTIIAENTSVLANGNPDLQSTAAVASDGRNLLGKGNGVLGLTGSDMTGVDPMLGPVLYNGGNTASRVPLPGSPVIGKGANPFGAAFDQRGAGYSRSTQGKVDVGAVQFDADNAAPVVSAVDAPNVTLDSDAHNTYRFVVQYSDPTAINRGSIDGGDIVVVGPNGYSQKATVVAIDLDDNGTPMSVRYQIVPPGGKWSPTANGAYTVILQSNHVFDDKGRPVAGGAIGAFNVNVYGDDVGYVGALYQTVLQRSADAEGLKAFGDRLNAGASRAEVAKEIWESREHREVQVKAYYRSLFQREPEAEGLRYWVQQMLDGASEETVIAQLLASNEFTQVRPGGSTLTESYYRGLFGRAADAGATEYAAQLSSQATTPHDVALELALSDERMNNEVERLYQSILLRPSDSTAASWLSVAREEGLSSVAVEVLASEEFFRIHGARV